MRITNNHNLPKAFYRAVANDTYDAGDSDYSSTGMLVPPQQAHLKREHADEITEDAADRVWAIMGSSAHAILEQSAKPWRHFLNTEFDKLMETEDSSYTMVEGVPTLVDHPSMAKRLLDFSLATGKFLARSLRFQEINQIYAERRYFADLEVDGKVFKLSGQIDLMETVNDLTDLSDFKTLSVWGIVNKQDKMDDWQFQLSVNKWLAEKNGKTIHTTTIIAIIRDWSQNKAAEEMRNSYNGNPSYPQQAVISIPIPMLSTEEIEELMRIKIRGLEAEAPRECSDKEIWLRDSCYALYFRKGLKKASKLVRGKGEKLDKDAQEQLAIALGDPKKKDAYLEFRPGERPRCTSYCNVNQFCPQYQNYLNQQENT